MNPTTLVIGALQILAELVPSLVSGASAATITKIIGILEQAIPLAIQVGEDLVGPIRNIITALRSSGTLTQEQIDQLDAAEAKLDADFDAAANAAEQADAASSGSGSGSA